MIAFLFALGVFVASTIAGLGTLAALRFDVRELRLALIAPAVGSAMFGLGFFVVNYAGAPLAWGGPLVFAILGPAFVVAAWRAGVRVDRRVWVVMAVCLGGALIVAWPMFRYGFDWVANANDDMANYVLSAQRLVGHGLFAPIDVNGLIHDRSFSSVYQPYHSAGVRPAWMLAGLSGLVGRPPYALFMPLLVGLHMCAISAVAGLALQFARRWWAAVVAASLFAIAPLSTYGVVQQLLPQVWGVGMAAAVLVVIARREVHGTPGPRIGDIVAIGILVAALVLDYVELASTLGLAYGLYIVVLASRHEIRLRKMLKLWGLGLLIPAALLNVMGLRELQYLQFQITNTNSVQARAAHIFDYSLAPSALSTVVGLSRLSPGDGHTYLRFAILVSAALIALALVLTLLFACRGAAAAVVLVADAVLAVYLASGPNAFGLFKLYMYVQPFLAAAAAVWIAALRRPAAMAVAFASVGALSVAMVSVEQSYVRDSTHPGDLVHASNADLLPVFSSALKRSTLPVVSLATNPVLIKLEAARAGGRSVYFAGRDVFTYFLLLKGLPGTGGLSRAETAVEEHDGWHAEVFHAGAVADPFTQNHHSMDLIASRACMLVYSSGTEETVNRRSFPEGSSSALLSTSCRRARNLLAFTHSDLGESFYLFNSRRLVSYYQLEPDYFFPGRTFAAYGRYVLFQTINATSGARLAIDLTTSTMGLGGKLPPAAVYGADRSLLPVVGRGSARVFSRPLTLQIVGRARYLLLDMGRPGQLLPQSAANFADLFGRNLRLDPRYVTAFVRDVSLISSTSYHRMKPPAAITRFPQGLANPALEYSGFYEDGWVAEEAYAKLAGGPASRLEIRADNVLDLAGQRLEVRIDGKPVHSQAVTSSTLYVTIPVSAARATRRVELRWSRVARLGAHDSRVAAAHISFIGFRRSTGRAPGLPTEISRFPLDLHDPAVESSGVYDDGWLDRSSDVVLAGGAAAVLSVRAQVPAASGQRLTVLVRGRVVASRHVDPGAVNLRIPIPASAAPRRVELRFARTIKLEPPDTRRAAALLEFLGIVPTRLRRAP